MQWNSNWWNTEKNPNKIKNPDIWNCCTKSMWQLQSLSEVSVWGPEQMTVSRNLVMKHSKFRQRHRITPMNDVAQSYRIFQTWWWQRRVFWNTIYSTPVQSLDSPTQNQSKFRTTMEANREIRKEIRQPWGNQQDSPSPKTAYGVELILLASSKLHPCIKQ